MVSSISNHFLKPAQSPKGCERRIQNYFISMRPAYRGNLIRLVRMINEELHAMASQMEREIEHVPNVQVRYSNELAKTDLSRVEVIHAVDGWHPSAQGHNVFAKAAFS